jgi:hypothetical protein
LDVDIPGPILLMVAVLLGIACCVIILAGFAGTGVFGASGSTELVSTGSALTSELPVMGSILGAGFVLIALGRRRS